MKLFTIAAALVIAGPAIAQDVPQQSAPAEDPRGGYMPAEPLYPQGRPAPGSTVIFVPSTQTPSQAFPPPAAQKSYPICKPGQFDNCRQRGG